MNASEVQLGKAYFVQVGRGENRRIDHVVLLNSDSERGWWAYCPATHHRCRVKSVTDLLGEYPPCS